MSAAAIALMLVAWGVAGASPGPATLAIAGTSMQHGRAPGLALATGVICGSACWGIAAALGMGALMLTHVWAVEVLRYVGAAYLIFLAFKAAKSAMSSKPLTAIAGQNRSLRRHFTKGFLIHITNPKAIFAWGAIFAVGVPPAAGSVVIAQTFGALICVSCTVFWGYGVLFSNARTVRLYTQLRRWFEGAFAVLFGLAGLKILTTKIVP